MCALNCQKFCCMTKNPSKSPPAVSADHHATSVPEAHAPLGLEAQIDLDLVERVKGGDQLAFQLLVERYYSRITGFAYSLLKNAADAEEVAQDTFVRAYRSLGSFRGDAPLSVWLHRIARNVSRSRYAYFFRRRRQDTVSLDKPLSDNSPRTVADSVAAVHQSPVQEVVTAEFQALVDGCMEQLDAAHREILTLRNILHLSYEEIASALQISVGTVKSRIGRARVALRDLLHQAAPDFDADSGIEDFLLGETSPYGCEQIAQP